MTAFLVALVVAAAAPKQGPVLKAVSVELAVPVPKGWRLDDRTSAAVPVPGKRCVNDLWFDFLPGASTELTRTLIETESIEVTSAVRRWDERKEREVELAGHPAIQLVLPQMPERSVYFLAVGGGTLVIQAMALGEEAAEGCAPKQPEAASALVGSFFAPEVLARAEALSKTARPPVPRKLEEVPENLEACFAALEKALSKDDLEAMRRSSERGLSQYHHGLGTSLRNTWGLWGGSPLAKYFNGLGIHHPDDMSGIIIKSFWRHLNGQPLELEAQVAYFQRFWAIRTPPAAKPCADGKPSTSLFQLERWRPAQDRAVSVFFCKAEKAYWVWELDKGFYQPDAKLKRYIEKLRRESPGLSSAPLEE